MADFIPVPSTIQANVRFTIAGQLVENVLCFEYNTDFKNAADALYTSLETSWWSTLRTALSNQLTSNGVYMVDLGAQDGPVETYPVFTNPSGASAIGACPNNVAYCVTHRTAKRGRAYRGRTYVVGLPLDKVANSLLDTGNRDTIVSAFNDLRTDAASSSLTFVIASRRLNNAPRDTGVATPVEISIGRDLALDSQRRRLPTRGT